MPSIEILEKRTRSSKTHSLGGRKFSWDGTIGSIHYEDNGWKDIDNIFESAVAPWDWQMLKAGYHIRVKEDFTAGQIIEFEKQGETIHFQPMALEWTNDLDQIQPIVMPHEVAPVITNPEVDLLPAVGMPSHQGTIRWDDAYGEGIDFQWRCTPSRLAKILEIESLNKLPMPEQSILDGGNPVLRLNLIFASSKGCDIHIDKEKWDKRTKKQTFKSIEFRKDGEVLWGFMPLRYWGSYSGEDDALNEANEGQSIATLEKRGNKLYISVRIPHGWLQTAVYPVFIDTDVDEQVGASSDDARQDTDDSVSFTGTFINIDATTEHSGNRFPTVAVPSGATIGLAKFSMYIHLSSYDEAKHQLRGELAADAVTFTTGSNNIDARARTTATNQWDNATGFGAETGQLWEWGAPTGQPTNGVNIKSIIQEIIDQGGWASGNALVLIYEQHTSSSGTTDLGHRTYDYEGNVSGCKLHIEYEAGAEGWANIKNIRVGTGSITATDLSHIWFGTTSVAVADVAEFGGVAV